MKTIKKMTKEVEIVDDVICNKCGKSCKGEMGNFNGLIETKVIGAYDSMCLSDQDTYVFSLCEQCLVELFKTFKHHPQRTIFYGGIE